MTTAEAQKAAERIIYRADFAYVDDNDTPCHRDDAECLARYVLSKADESDERQYDAAAKFSTFFVVMTVAAGCCYLASLLK